jgi:hypothetical protein
VLWCWCLTIVINIHKQNNITPHKQIHPNQKGHLQKHKNPSPQNINNIIQTLCVMKSCLNT